MHSLPLIPSLASGRGSKTKAPSTTLLEPRVLNADRDLFPQYRFDFPLERVERAAQPRVLGSVPRVVLEQGFAGPLKKGLHCGSGGAAG